jgi:hypothetical protein
MIVEINVPNSSFKALKQVCSHMNLIYDIRSEQVESETVVIAERFFVSIQEAKDLAELLFGLQQMGEFEVIRNEDLSRPCSYILREVYQ